MPEKTSSEDILDIKLSRCLSDTLVKAGRPWPVLLGTGFGVGYGISNCNNDFKQPLPLVSHRIKNYLQDNEIWLLLVYMTKQDKIVDQKLYIGPRNSKSKIRPIKFDYNPVSETPRQKAYRLHYVDTWEWLDTYWKKHNEIYHQTESVIWLWVRGNSFLQSMKLLFTKLMRLKALDEVKSIPRSYYFHINHAVNTRKNTRHDQ